MFLHLRNIPTRLATGGYILHSGLEHWDVSEDEAKGMHAMAAGTFPLVGKLPPATFLKALSAAEIGIGAALLTPIVPNRIAGAALTAFSGGLVSLYLRTPALHKAGSIWPNQAGIAVSKDVWMLGVGLGLLADDACGRRPDTPR